MPNRITRQDSIEKNKTTAWWLYEFGYDLEKNAATTDYLKDYLQKNYNRKKFNSIEEKLADIKQRVGFDLAKKIVNEIEKTSSEDVNNAKDCGCKKSCKKCGDKCNCDKKCSCTTKNAKATKKSSTRKDKNAVSIMENILKYINDLVNDKPHLDEFTVLSKCREEEGLMFNNISKKIDHEKLMKHIKKLVSSKKHKDHDHMVYYIPYDQNSLGESQIDTAEYYNHAEPRRS